jgi:hypothetical protein
MTLKEEAEELVYKFLPFVDWNDLQDDCTNRDWAIRNAKKCALIAIDLHLEELSKMKLIFSDREIHYKHWKEVKQEIEKP